MTDFITWAPVASAAIAAIAAVFSAVSAWNSAKSAKLADRGQKATASYQILKDGRDLTLKIKEMNLALEDSLPHSFQFYASTYLLRQIGVIDSALWRPIEKELCHAIHDQALRKEFKKFWTDEMKSMYSCAFVNYVEDLLRRGQQHHDSLKHGTSCRGEGA